MKLRRICTGAPVVGMVFLSASAVADIQGSKHDLSTGIPEANGEVCVFCHTPHGSDTNASAPLWNKALPSTTYTRYSSLGTANLDGTEVAVGSVSLACLSCHDGTQAVDVVINKPGTGGYNAAGSELSTATGSNLSGTPIPNLGSDLRDDHPISIDYAGGACRGSLADCDPQTAATGDPDFSPAQYASINGQNQWWVDVASYATDAAGVNIESGTADVREKTDMLLYTRDFSGTEGPSVECASCHDPHEATARPVSFLRIANAGSGVCLACHIK
ncbi:MAG: hypothetical protein KDH88_12100 [Chromatiales bacterium]|nr:hypothetical protein [Chromatiales bacterium]